MRPGKGNQGKGIRGKGEFEEADQGERRSGERGKGGEKGWSEHEPRSYPLYHSRLYAFPPLWLVSDVPHWASEAKQRHWAGLAYSQGRGRTQDRRPLVPLYSSAQCASVRGRAPQSLRPSVPPSLRGSVHEH